MSKELTIDEKLNIIGNEYDIPIEENFRKDVSVMCNLSQGIKEKAFEGGYLMGQEEGRESGYAEAVCLMYESGLSIEQIAGIIKMSTDKVEELVNTDLMG